MFCPHRFITGAEMPVFILSSIKGTPTGFITITTSGVVGSTPHNCVTGGQTVLPIDVPPTHWACRFIHYMAANDVTSGCGTSSFCPDALTPRWQMAVVPSTAFGL